MATLVAAIAGLITAITQLGGSGSSDKPTAATTVVEATGMSAADRELLADIPASIRPSCGKAVNPEEGNAAAFNCSYRDLVHLQYNLFASDSELAKAFAATKARYGQHGDVLRFVDGGSASIVWTDAKHDILAFAWRDDSDQQALNDAWLVIDRAR